MSYDSLKKKLAAHAERKGFKLNPNEKMLKVLIDKLINNNEVKGDLYCPCRVELSDDFICPCKEHVRDVREKGHCHCFLFVK
ncbi:ferredoxin:thioredoxin reductase [archaeon]|nr:ferredoxin:thioredoxin reductase [archaeon]